MHHRGSPRAPAESTMQRASALCMLTCQPHCRPAPHAAKRRVESTLHKKTPIRDFVRMNKLSSHVTEEDSPHRPAVLGANRHSGGAVLHVGLCRQNADATVNFLRETLRFHGHIVLCSFRHESSGSHCSHLAESLHEPLSVVLEES